MRSTRSHHLVPSHRPTHTLVLALALTAAVALPVRAQQTTPTGSLAGKVTDARGNPVNGAEVSIPGLRLGVLTQPNGEYLLAGIPAGSQSIAVQTLGYRTQTATVSIAEGQRATQDFTLTEDPLNLDAVVVTGTQAPRLKLDASVAITTLSSKEVEQSMPRSTTELLRYVPGFTRVESSGGEVNQNITMRGILGVEYVMFMEDGLPVFPTMHTFFMNADNLFRPDENIQRVEVVRGGSSALFGSNTPGAIVNFINKTGSASLGGSLKVSAATKGLARYDFNVNGPLGNDWRFNVGGFYRYDHGVRDPGFPGIRGGQLKANVTRLLEHGFLRASAKVIDDRNQFILDLPFQGVQDPKFVPGFSDYGSMNTKEGLDISVPTPDGRLELPLSDGIRTRAYWLTAETNFEVGEGWLLQNAAQIMGDQEGWNAILPFDAMPAADFVTRPTDAGGLGFPEGTPFRYTFTNLTDASGNPAAFNTANGLVAPGGEWHVSKPLTAFQDQFQVKKTLGPHTFTGGLYFANYSQDNHWYFTDILLNVADNPNFLDLTVNGEPITQNGFRHYVSNYVNGSGQTTVVSGSLGASVELTPKLRADAGVRYEHDDYVQSAENTSNVDLDGNPATPFDNEVWGNGSFRHIERGIGDWAASLGLNYGLTDRVALYAVGSRAYKMPALDEFLNITPQTAGGRVISPQEQVDLFEPQRDYSVEGGVKYSAQRLGFTVNGFFTTLKNVTSQGAVTDPNTGNLIWTIQTNPQVRSYGAEVELSAIPVPGLTALLSGTVLKADYASCPAQGTTGANPCPTGADVGTLLTGVPPVIGNLSLTYNVAGITLLGDEHFVAKRYSTYAANGQRNFLPSYAYTNFGVSYAIPNRSMTLDVALQNAFQSKGLEEGNPRLSLIGGRTSDLFLARPILPRRIMASLRYDF